MAARSSHASEGPSAGAGALALRALLFLLAAIVFLIGLWVAGGKITNNFDVAMVLSGLWFVGAGIAAAGIAWRWRRVAVPVLAGYLVAAAVSGGYLLLSMRDKTVTEQVAAVSAASGNTRIASGAFRSGAHETSGTAAVIQLKSGERQLQLLEFETDPGPDLRVYLAERGDTGSFKDLGGLKGNRGTQQYSIPRDVDVERYSAVLIWCRAFSVEFGRAQL